MADELEVERGHLGKRLAMACMGSDADEARKLLAAGANPNDPCAWMHGWGGRSGSTEAPAPLHMAFRHGDAEVAKALLEAGADMEQPSGNGIPMVAWLGMGLASCAALWIEAGGDPWKTYGEGASRIALAEVACRGGGEDLWRLIASRARAEDLARTGCGGDQWGGAGRRGEKTVPQRALEWQNMEAIEALHAIGWIPGSPEVMECCDAWVDGMWSSQRRGKALKRAGRLFEMGAGIPEKSAMADLARFMGQPKIDELRGLLEISQANGEALAIRRAAKAGKAKAKKPKTRL